MSAASVPMENILKKLPFKAVITILVGRELLVHIPKVKLIFSNSIDYQYMDLMGTPRILMHLSANYLVTKYFEIFSITKNKKKFNRFGVSTLVKTDLGSILVEINLESLDIVLNVFGQNSIKNYDFFIILIHLLGK